MVVFHHLDYFILQTLLAREMLFTARAYGIRSSRSQRNWTQSEHQQLTHLELTQITVVTPSIWGQPLQYQ